MGNEAWVDSLLRSLAASPACRGLDADLAARLKAAAATIPKPGRDLPAVSATCTGAAVPAHAAPLPAGQAVEAAAPVEPEAAPQGEAAPEGEAEASSAELAAPEEAVPPPPPVLPPPPPPSAHYVPKVKGVPDVNYDPAIPDEYRDDADPGFRVREVTESELLEELQAKYAAFLAEQQCVALGASGLSVHAAVGEDDDELLLAQRSVSREVHIAQPASVLAADSAALAAAPAAPEPAMHLPQPVHPAHMPAEPVDATAPQATLASQAMHAMQAQAAAAAVAQVPGAGMLQVPLMPHALAHPRKDRRRSDRPPCRHPDSGDPFYPVELDGVVFDSFALRVVYERDRTGFEASKEFPIQLNSIVAARYQVLEYLGSAAFSRAVQCLDLQTNRMVCMKIIKNDKDFVDQSLDEIKLLKIINANTHDIDEKHCLALIDYFYHKEHLIIVTELLRDNLYEFSKFNRECGDQPYFTLGRLQKITKQVLTALEYIHQLWLVHADLKPENILIKSYSRCEVKVIDFGSSCYVDDQLTSYVQSRSYRAPEVMLGLPYGQKIDIWSLGCIVAELWTGYVLFQNDCIQSLLARIIGIVGPIPVHMMTTGRFVPQYFVQDGRLFREIETAQPGSAGGMPCSHERRLHLYLPKRSSLRQRMRTDDEVFLDFLTHLLKVDPEERPTATEALQHPWLTPGHYLDGL